MKDDEVAGDWRHSNCGRGNGVRSSGSMLRSINGLEPDFGSRE